jgi:thiol:disulfide interchange protein
LTNRKNLHLTISTIIITSIAFVYGLFPHDILPQFFDFKVESTDLKQVFRAMMGLYLGMVALWLIGIFKPSHWKTATIANVLFMIGLAFGRIISLVMDGIPSIAFSIGLALELILALWGIKNLNKYRATRIQSS